MKQRKIPGARSYRHPRHERVVRTVKAEKVGITLPPNLYKKLTKAATRDRLSRSAFISYALERILENDD